MATPTKHASPLASFVRWLRGFSPTIILGMAGLAIVALALVGRILSLMAHG